MVRNATQVSATGDVTTDRSLLDAVVLTGGSAASTCTVRAGGASGTVIATVKAAIDTTVTVPLDGVFCSGGIHVTLAGTGAVATIVHR